MTTGKPDAAASIASLSASNFDRVYGPGISSAVSKVSSTPSPSCGRGTKQNGLGRAMEQSRNTTFARRRNDDLSAPAIDVMKSSLRATHMPGRPARWYTSSTPSSAWFTNSRSSTEPLMYCAFATARPGGRRSRTRVCRPLATSVATKCWPMKPLPPVTRTQVIDLAARRPGFGAGRPSSILVEFLPQDRPLKPE